MNKLELSAVLKSDKVALIVIDMQGDYCSPGYYMDKAGYDIERLCRPIPHIRQVLVAARQEKLPIIFTRQYRIEDGNSAAPDQDSFPLTSLRGEPGWEIIPELKPENDEIVLDKTTCGVFMSTDIHDRLQELGITTLLFCGNTFDVCVHSSLRNACDLNYKCITIADACGAVNDHLYDWSIESIEIEDGAFGSVASSQDVVEALQS